MASNKTVTKRAYTRLDFSLEQEEKLVDHVKMNSALYNPKDEHYKNKTYRDRLWEKFGETIDKPGDFHSSTLNVSMMLTQLFFHS